MVFDYDNFFFVTAWGTKMPQPGESFIAAIRSIYETEGWPLEQTLRCPSFQSCRLEMQDSHMDLWIEYRGIRGPAGIVVHLPYDPNYINVEHLVAELKECLERHVENRHIAPEAVETAEALAQDLKYTHPGFRHMSRCTAPMSEPVLERLFGHVGRITGEAQPFGTACVVNNVCDPEVTTLARLMTNRQITVVDPSPVAGMLMERRFPGLKTLQNHVGDVPGDAPCQHKEAYDLCLGPRLQNTGAEIVAKALNAMGWMVKPNGWIICSVRTHRTMLAELGIITLPRPTASEEQIRILSAANDTDDLNLKTAEPDYRSAVENYVLIRKE